jgi:hypothetical protein
MTDTTPSDELLIEAASNYASKHHDGKNYSDLMNAYFAGAAWQTRAALEQQAEPDKMTDPVERARYWKLRALAAEGQVKGAATLAKAKC